MQAIIKDKYPPSIKRLNPLQPLNPLVTVLPGEPVSFLPSFFLSLLKLDPQPHTCTWLVYDARKVENSNVKFKVCILRCLLNLRFLSYEFWLFMNWQILDVNLRIYFHFGRVFFAISQGFSSRLIKAVYLSHKHSLVTIISNYWLPLFFSR